MVDDNINNTAHAPYNFIPLNEQVVSCEGTPDNDRYYSNNEDSSDVANIKYSNTGYIDLNLEAITPIYIRNTKTSGEYSKNDEELKKSDRYSNFFSPGDKIRIPGSSIRGMIRTLVEILSFGKLSNFENKHLYYRTFDKSSLSKDYRQKVPKNAIKCGYLVKQDNRYVIYPSKEQRGKQYFIIKYKVDEKNEEYSSVKNVYGDNENIKFLNNITVYFEPKFLPRKDIAESISLINQNDFQEGVLIPTGHVHGKKHHVIILSRSKNRIEVSNEAITKYENDKQRLDKINILNINDINGVPCFYITETKKINGENREVVSEIGHTLMFRTQYNNSISDCVSQNFSETEPDIVNSIFGNIKSFSGRVNFEDASVSGTENVMETKAETPKLLMEPKPSCFQHYLDQNHTTDAKDLKNYNSPDAKIRGRKLYWHKNADWIESDSEKIEKSQQRYVPRIKPVKPGTIFIGRIRFENLSNVELGALLRALDLPENCCHKIGMGKPYGLGSIKIKPELHLSNRVERYKNLFFEFSENIPKNNNIKQFKDSFDKYIEEHIGGKKVRDEIYNELFTMLNLKVMRQNTDYMEIERADPSSSEKINEYKDRPILPLPSKVG
jgi:CRISPR-associated protein (TIGR03986 family)